MAVPGSTRSLRSTDNHRMRLRFWIGLAAVVADRRRLGRRGAGRPRRRQRRLPRDAAATRPTARPTRPRRSAALSVGELASAAAFFQADGDARASTSSRSIARSLLRRGRARPRPPSSSACRRPTRAAYEREHGVAIVERSARRQAAPASGRRPVYFPLTYRRRRARPPAARSATTSAPTRPRAAYLRRARDSGKPAATRVVPAAARRQRHHRLPAGLPRRRPDRHRRRAPRRAARLRRRQLQGRRPRRARRSSAVPERRSTCSCGSASGAVLGPGGELDDAARGAGPDRRPHLAAGRPRPQPARASACRCCSAVIGISLAAAARRR